MSTQATPGDRIAPTAAQMRQTTSDTITRLHVPRVIWGTVEDITAAVPGVSAATITVQKSSGGDPVPVQFLGNYTPTVGDTVVGFSVAQDYWVIGGPGVGATVIPPSGAAIAAASDIDTLENTTSTSYANLTTVGPAVTIKTGSQCFVSVTASMINSTAAVAAYMGFAVSGATTVAAADRQALASASPSVFSPGLSTARFLVQGLTPGLNTFTAKYKTIADTESYQYRSLVVEP